MRIAAVTMAIPPRVQTAQEIASLIHRSAEWIQQHTGVLHRRIAEDDVSPAQLAADAARQAIAIAGQPDLILYAGALTQQLVPDTSVFVQRELMLERIPCFTINQTCLSFIAALQVAHGLLKVGTYKRILICTGELATRGRSFEEPESAALLGDGGAAAIVEYSDENNSDLIHCSLETWSELRASVAPCKHLRHIWRPAERTLLDGSSVSNQGNGYSSQSFRVSRPGRSLGQMRRRWLNCCQVYRIRG